MRTKCQWIATFHRPIHSHWSLPLIWVLKHAEFHAEFKTVEKLSYKFFAMKPSLYDFLQLFNHFEISINSALYDIHTVFLKNMFIKLILALLHTEEA